MGAKTLEDLENEVRRGPSPRRASFVRPSVRLVRRARSRRRRLRTPRAFPPSPRDAVARTLSCMYFRSPTNPRSGKDESNESNPSLMTTLVPNLAPTPVRTQRAALEQEAYDEKNKLLNQAQFQELLDLQTDEEPDFVHEARSIHWSPYDRVGVVNADP